MKLTMEMIEDAANVLSQNTPPQKPFFVISEKLEEHFDEHLPDQMQALRNSSEIIRPKPLSE